MPTYDYSCRSCGARFEAWQKMSDDPITICPTCGGPVHRILYPVGLVFKGSGFYSTDNRSSSNGSNGHHSDTDGDTHKEESPATAPAASASSDSNGNSGAASETKSGAKAEPAASTAPAAGATSAAKK